MAETLGIITSTIQLVDTALKAREYVKDFANASQEQRQLFSEMETLRPLLGELQTRVQANPMRNSFQQMTAPLKGFETTVQEFTEKLKPADSRWTKFSKKLAWTLWNKKEAKEYLEELERIKLLLNTWLVLDIWDVGEHQQQDTDKILKAISNTAKEQQHSHNRIINMVGDVAQQEVLDEREKLIEWFSPLNPFPRQAEIFDSRQPGTGEWFLEYHHFKAWMSSLGGIMWCHGIPGAGKTVLASLVVHHLRTQFQAGNIGVASIYLNHKETEIQSPSNLIASLWRQLVFNKPLSSAVSTLYMKHHEQDTRPTLNEIHSQFSSAVAEYLKVYIVVDALDEYPEEGRSILLDALAKIQPMVNLILTSRPHISSFFPGAQILEIRATEEDIRCYVEKQIQGSVRLSKHIATRPEFREEIKTKLVRNADGMFLLAKLHIHSLATKNTIRALRDALKNMPTDLKHTYDEAMERIDRQSEDDRKIARLVLIWVSNAKRPLSIGELQEALAVEPDDTTFDSDNILDVDIMLSVCAGLVIVDQTDQIARLVHYTAQQYLDSIQSSRFPQAQLDITRTCLTYLSFEMFAKLPKYPHELIRNHPFLAYAAECCLPHAKGQSELPLKHMILAYLDSGFSRFYMCVVRYSYEVRQRHRRLQILLARDTPKIWIAAAFNLCQITRHLLLETYSELNPALRVASRFGAVEAARLLINSGADRDGLSSALVGASKAGHQGIVRLLIENGADVNLGYGDNTALYAACYWRHESIARNLIENEANVNSVGGPNSYTCLRAASAAGSEPLIRLLLANGATIDCSALRAASKNGHEGIARLLLQSGASVDRRALEYAAEGGHLRMVKLLVRHATNVDLSTALDSAALCQVWDVVQELVENGGLDLRENEGQALLVACHTGQEAIVSLLINHGIDVNASKWVQFRWDRGHGNRLLAQPEFKGCFDDRARRYPLSALQIASFKGHETIVKLLLQHDANVDIDGRPYGTPLQAAVHAGHNGVVRILLDNGANINFTGEIPESALQIALARGDVELSRLLVDRGAAAEPQVYNDALCAVVQRGLQKQEELDERLRKLEGQQLEKQRQVEKESELGEKSGLEEQSELEEHQELEVMKLENMVRFLIDSGADVNSQDKELETALEVAAAEGSKSMVKLLLEKGARIHGGFHGGALHAAAAAGQESIVRLLLLHGADVNAWGGPYGSALCAALWNDHENIVRLLESAGGQIVWS
ncbi:ankyrin repeat-containing domain protein [Mycena rosella]|uniref:Ankyrin repeat-containing domain protein n=1 Tax=Mycena rosella TaxID=1033263 RepID=A0AAD7GHI2_MYCRO|nr:ankyrin repeat-containing domain protein [Mycena rosella]